MLDIKFDKELPEIKGNYFVTSDLHFGHKNILNFCADTRPWGDVDEMNEGLIQAWNDVVTDGDVVFHLGDFCYKAKKGYEQELISRLNGEIIFIMGNHDQVIRNNVNNNLKYDYLQVRYRGQQILLFHNPIECWTNSGYGSILLYGHVHGKWQVDGRGMDVGWDANGHILMLDEAVEICLNRPIVTKEY